MSNFIPTKGDFFYVSMRPYQRVIGGGFGDVAEKVVTQQDNSYSGDVFVCQGRDDHALVGEKKAGSAYSSNYTFVHSRVTYFPVGPEVKQALGLTEGEQA